jgi:hypothetical protein
MSKIGKLSKRKPLRRLSFVSSSPFGLTAALEKISMFLG